MGSVKGEDYPVSLRSEQASSTSGGDTQHLAAQCLNLPFNQLLLLLHSYTIMHLRCHLSAWRPRPDIGPILTTLNDYRQRAANGASEFINSMTQDALQEPLYIICGTCCLTAAVKNALGYHGQEALALGRGGFGAEDQVTQVIRAVATLP